MNPIVTYSLGLVLTAVALFVLWCYECGRRDKRIMDLYRKGVDSGPEFEAACKASSGIFE